MDDPKLQVGGMREDGKAKLMALLHEIFDDGLVEVKERERLVSARTELGLDNEEIHAIFEGFLEEKWGEAMSDDVLTNEERLVLKRVIQELHIPDERVPVQARLALRDL